MNADIHSLSGAYVVDAIDDAERDAFEAHLAVCDACRQEIDELRAATELLADAAWETPPPALRADVLAAIEEVRPLPPLTAPAVDGDPVVALPPAPARRRLPPWLPVVAAAAVLPVVVALVWSPWSTPDDGPTMTARAVSEAPDARRIAKDLGGFEATVVVSRRMDKAAIFSDDMPAAPRGKQFQLWYSRPGRGMEPAGLMPASAPDGQAVMLDGPVGDATAIGVTVEPMGGSPAPTSDPVAVIDIS